ncbi:MAG TPA: hypothetical protein VIW02_09395 [Gammaproteobacteria bacterium]
MDEATFRQMARQRGYGEPRTKRYPPDSTSDLHTHELECLVLVLEGDFILATESGSTRYSAGETCTLPAATRHAEGAGAEGASILVATR